MATPGATCLTITLAPAPTAGTRTAWPASATTSSACASPSRSGTAIDPILKERIFGLTGNEGNHGEDAKELWWYLDSTPTHSWMRWAYVYPQREFPYERLVAENRARGRQDPEFELLDTGILDDDRYWDITVDYAKAAPDDIGVRVRLRNAGPNEATLHVLPTAVVPQHLVVGPRRPQAGHRRQGRRPGGRAPRPRPHGAGRRRLAGAALLRQRVERPAAVGRRGSGLPEGRDRRPRRARCA